MSQAIQSVKYGALPVLVRQHRPEPLSEDVKDKLRKIVERVDTKI